MNHLPIFLMSAISLSYQILLMKILSIIQWAPLVTFVIALSMLGYGMSGIVLYHLKLKLYMEEKANRIRIILAFLYSWLGFFCFLVFQKLPLNPAEIAWSKDQFLYFALAFTLLSLPTLCARTFIGSYYLGRKTEGARIYFYDLLGSGVGSLAPILFLNYFKVERSFIILCSIGFIISAFILLTKTARKRLASLPLFFCVLTNFIWPAGHLELKASAFKPLSQMKQFPGVEVIKEKDGDSTRITVLKSPEVPFRFVPGLSLNFGDNIPEQIGIYLNGDHFIAIDKISDLWQKVAYYDFTLNALPYEISQQRERILIIGEGGGSSAHHALLQGFKNIDVVLSNLMLVEILQNDMAYYNAGLFNNEKINFHAVDGRNFINRSKFNYDIIHFTLWQSQIGQMSSAYAVETDYMLTHESFNRVFDLLTPHGLFTISRWVSFPPKDSVRLLSLCVELLKKKGIQGPGKHLALLRDIQTSFLILSKAPLTHQQIRTIREFAKTRAFDLVYLPGLAKEETNQFHVYHEPLDFLLAQAIVNNINVTKTYKYDLSPPSDDRPFFSQFMKMNTLIELLRSPSSSGKMMVEWSHLLEWLTLLISLIASLFFILIPSFWYFSRANDKQGLKLISFPILYFSFLGIGFMLFEITLIKKFTLFLEHPIYAVSMVYDFF
ncbi:MAG: hypothetical protein HYV97_08060 [Bdellovibrio sp.]|nr:hypothetical protein [Bdellovibrio sp.]